MSNRTLNLLNAWNHVVLVVIFFFEESKVLSKEQSGNFRKALTGKRKKEREKEGERGRERETERESIKEK